MTRIQVFQHVPFEDAANIGVWAAERGCSLSYTRFYESDPLPGLDELDWLVIMGGPMNIYQHDRYPWLAGEKAFIRQAIESGKKLLGVCLGGQLIADVLGGAVSANPHREIGWFPCRLTSEGQGGSLLAGLKSPFTAFHWHGDTFAIPPGAVRLAGSEACPNQAFQYGDRVLGMQFHFDYARPSIEKMIRHCSDELTDGAFVQTDPAVLLDPARFDALYANLVCVLDALHAVPEA